MPKGAKITITLVYAFAAIAGPIFIALFPGEPPILPNYELTQVEGDRFVTPEQALGEGAESYDYDVLNDQVDRLAGASAVYPDGGSALVARFSNVDASIKAAEVLVELIPHKAYAEDLWSIRFQADSGDFVLISHVDELLFLIIADTEETMAQRFEAIPALIHNPEPGFGAVVANQPAFQMLLVMLGYGLFQLITVSRLVSWTAKSTPTPGQPVATRDEVINNLGSLADAGPWEVETLVDGDVWLTWDAESAREKGYETLYRLRLAFDDDMHVVRACLYHASLKTHHSTGERVDGELAWEKKMYVPFMGYKAQLLAKYANGHFKIDNLHQAQYSSDELYHLASLAVVDSGWSFRPVVSFSKFVSG